MKERVLVPAVVALALPALALAGGTAKGSLEANLSGAKETPKGAPAGKAMPTSP